MKETEMAPDPSVKLTHLAEQLHQANERRAARNLRDRVFTLAALAIVAITAGMVGYVLLVTTDSRTNAEVAACRSEFSAAVQVGVARALSGLSEAATVDGDTGDQLFRQELRRTADDLERRAAAYDAAAQLSGQDPDAFLDRCKESP